MNKLFVKKRKRQNNLILWIVSLFLIISVCSGCALTVKLVGEYDAIVDNAVTDLQKETAVFFSKMKTASSADTTYKANKDFYDDAHGKVSTLIIRSEVIEQGLKRNPLTKNFKDLQLQYQDLAEQHKKIPSKKYFESAEKAFNQSFRAILENILYLKWNQTQSKK